MHCCMPSPSRCSTAALVILAVGVWVEGASKEGASRPGRLAPRTGLSGPQGHLHDPAYWLDLCPGLHIFGGAEKGDKATARLSEARRAREDLEEDGYAKIERPGAVVPAAIVSRLRRGVSSLVQAGWPATFIMVYDECWDAVRGMEELLRHVQPGVGFVCSFDIVAWHVDPGSRQAGFSPHRDRQPEDWTQWGLPPDVELTFSRDQDGKQTAKYTTCWLALSDATPDNSCLHFLPRPFDPGYLAGDCPDEDPMLRAFAAGKETFQHIRPVPLVAGACTLHTHRVIHWGSAPKPGSRLGGSPPQARVALSCAFSTRDFEPPYIKPRYNPTGAGGRLSFTMRLALSGAQVLNYGDRWIGQVPPRVFRTCHALFLEQKRKFVKTYRAEVNRKFAHVSSEMRRRNANMGSEQQPVPARCETQFETSDDDGSAVAAEVQAAAQEEEDRWAQELTLGKCSNQHLSDPPQALTSGQEQKVELGKVFGEQAGRKEEGMKQESDGVGRKVFAHIHQHRIRGIVRGAGRKRNERNSRGAAKTRFSTAPGTRHRAETCT